MSWLTPLSTYVSVLLIRYSRLRWINAQCSCERDQVVLLVDKNRADGLAERIFVQLLSLLQATTTLTDRLVSLSRSKRSISSAFSEVFTGFD
jgi:hypothetical protein